MVKVTAVAVLVLAASLLVAWMLRPEVAGPCVHMSGPVSLPEIPETSGLAVSRRTPGLLWSHNDSGNVAVLFALDTGGVRGRVSVPVNTRDWEDVSAGGCPSGECLYIADIGDNESRRRNVEIYRVPEPASSDTETAMPEAFTATYADGPHNAEAMFVLGEDLFIITRDRIGALYRASAPATGRRELVFQRLGQLGLEAVTDAEASPDETAVVVRTSQEALLYRAADLTKGATVPTLRIPIAGLREPQGEGVAVDGDRFYLSSEGGRGSRAGSLISLRCEIPH